MSLLLQMGISDWLLSQSLRVLQSVLGLKSFLSSLWISFLWVALRRCWISGRSCLGGFQNHLWNLWRVSFGSLLFLSPFSSSWRLGGNKTLWDVTLHLWEMFTCWGDTRRCGRIKASNYGSFSVSPSGSVPAKCQQKIAGGLPSVWSSPTKVLVSLLLEFA